MSIFENMDAREIAMGLSAFYEAGEDKAVVYYLPSRGKPVTMDRDGFDEGIKILRDDYEVFWTPDTKPDDLKYLINKRRMKELQDRIAQGSWYGATTGVAFGPGCVITGNDDAYRRALGLPDDATVADILEKIRRLKGERDTLYVWKKRHQMITNSWYGACSGPGCAVDNNYAYRRVLGLLDNAPVADILERIKELKDENSELAQELKTVEQDKQKLKETVENILRDRSNIERLRRHWHTKLENSVEALKKRIRSMEAEAQEKETKNKVITDTLRDNLVDSIEECKKLQARIHELERTIRTLDDEDDE